MMIRVINGPNLNRLGLREPHIYGSKTFRDLEGLIEVTAESLGLHVEVLQSNNEGTLIDWIHDDASYDALIINPGALSHTSVALMDALLSIDCPVVEVHLSNVHARETFRHELLSARAAQGVITGLGFEGYLLALRYLASL